MLTMMHETDLDKVPATLPEPLKAGQKVSTVWGTHGTIMLRRRAELIGWNDPDPDNRGTLRDFADPIVRDQVGQYALEVRDANGQRHWIFVSDSDIVTV